ncbi:MAG: tRNA glutamyl-Q(34) synthetase GluQRS [Phycisphaerae bacterium]|nr:tRNA glutamyl-Q(34) synthetase GluQRS [Phycisphaerae bacterium]
MKTEHDRTTRLAPSPTGRLHMGNAWALLLNWAIARANHWRVLLRMEDLDDSRVREGDAEVVLEDLRWLGIDHDGPVHYQSRRIERYREALQSLQALDRTYACSLSRRQIEEALSAPHEHPGTIVASLGRRHEAETTGVDGPTNQRFVCEEGVVHIEDVIAGSYSEDPGSTVGDFIIWTKQGVPAYQLAVVVEDADMGVTDVIRGNDLLSSSARQVRLYEVLDKPAPRWWHLPLVVDQEGRRLAKRHGDRCLEAYRQSGVSAQKIIGLIARWCGFIDRHEPLDVEVFLQLAACQDWTKSGSSFLSGPVMFTEEDHQWLMERS